MSHHSEELQTSRGYSDSMNLRGSAQWQWHPTPVLLPGKSHQRRSLVGCSPWGRKQSDTTEWLHFHFSLSCIGEGNGNPLQCSCLENPRDGGAWWAVIYGVAQSRTRLKWLSSSSSCTYSVFVFKIHKRQSNNSLLWKKHEENRDSVCNFFLYLLAIIDFRIKRVI